jgi:hypothetical protein
VSSLYQQFCFWPVIFVQEVKMYFVSAEKKKTLLAAVQIAENN